LTPGTSSIPSIRQGPDWAWRGVATGYCKIAPRSPKSTVVLSVQPSEDGK
jgi:hypothetical protein